MVDSGSIGTQVGPIVSVASSHQVSSVTPSMGIVPLASKPIMDKKASVYAEVVKSLNSARERGLPFKVRPILFISLQFNIYNFLYIILK